MGIDFRSVTASIVGKTKLFYDILGDIANIASKINSTGEKGQIEVPEPVAGWLEPILTSHLSLFDYRWFLHFALMQ